MHPIASDRVRKRGWTQRTLGFRRKIRIRERNLVKPRVELGKKRPERMHQNHGPERLGMPNPAGKLTDAPKLLDVKKRDTTAGIGELGCRAAIQAVM